GDQQYIVLAQRFQRIAPRMESNDALQIGVPCSASLDFLLERTGTDEADCHVVQPRCLALEMVEQRIEPLLVGFEPTEHEYSQRARDRGAREGDAFRAALHVLPDRVGERVNR